MYVAILFVINIQYNTVYIQYYTVCIEGLNKGPLTDPVIFLISSSPAGEGAAPFQGREPEV